MPRLLLRTTPPAIEPVTLEEAKLFLRVDHDDEDDIVEMLITAAREFCEEYTGRSLITQGWRIAFDDALYHNASLPRGPVQSITAVTAYDENESPTVISADVYSLNAARDAIQLNSEILAARVEVAYTTGYGDAGSDVPAAIRQGILTHIATMFDNRGTGGIPVPMPLSTLGLYGPYRVMKI